MRDQVGLERTHDGSGVRSVTSRSHAPIDVRRRDLEIVEE
jgi:hypothetical protein